MALPLSSNSSPRSESQLASASTSTPHNSASPASTSSPQPHQPPAVTITPASPSATPGSAISITLEPPVYPPTTQQRSSPAPTSNTAEMKEKDSGLPTDSQTALLNSGSSTTASKEGETANSGTPLSGAEASKSSTLATLTRRLSGRNTSTTPTAAPASTARVSPISAKEKPSTSNVAAPSSNQTSSSPQTSSSSSKPSTTTKPIQRASQKKKRKRKGLAGLLLALGCLSANEFEDDSTPMKSNSQSATTPASAPATTSARSDNGPTTTTAATPATGTTKPKETAVGPSSVQTPNVAASGPTLTPTETPVDGAQAGNVPSQQEKEIVLAPAEPHILPEEETAGVTSSAVQPPGGGSAILLGTPTRPHPQRRESDTAVDPTADVARTETSGAYTESEAVDDGQGQTGDEGIDEYMDDEYEDEEDRLIEQGGMGIPIDENGQPCPLLPPIIKAHSGRKCLVLDLDETLLHSSFKSLPTADYIVPVEIESQIHNVYVIKRPGVDNFLKEMGKIYEVVVFTASLSKYADPVLDMLDTHGVVTHRLFRESCYNHKGNYVKDLSQLGRDIETSIIIDNSPASYIFHPNNAVPVSTWFNDPHDTELTDLCPFLADLATVDDVRGVLDGRLTYSR